MRFFFFLILAASLFADLEDQLKKLENKSNGHGLENVDFIYLINLDQRPEKWNHSIDQLTPFGIYPCRFSAVNGWELTLEQINDVGVKYSPEMEGNFMATCYRSFEPTHENICRFGQTYFGHCLARGSIGIALSHISILQDAFDSGYETIWVMEDDIEVIQDPRILSALIQELDKTVGKENWDILFTDKDIRNRNGFYVPTYYAGRRPDYHSNNHFSLRNPINSHFIQIGARSGAHSMIIRRSGIKKLLHFFKANQIFLPYDMDFILPRGIKLYTVAEDIVSNLPHAVSDNGGPNYLTPGNTQ